MGCDFDADEWLCKWDDKVLYKQEQSLTNIPAEVTNVCNQWHHDALGWTWYHLAPNNPDRILYLWLNS